MIECVYAGSLTRIGANDPVLQKRMQEEMEMLNKQNREKALKQLNEIIEKEEKDDERRKKAAASQYDKQAESRIKSIVFDPNLSFKENADKHKIKIIEVESLSEAGTFAKKYSEKDSNYIVQQIETINELSLYKISTNSPYYISDTHYKKIKTKTLDYPGINYKKTFVLDYPDYGISTKRNYKFLTLSKTETNKELNFGKGEIVFVQKGLDLNVKMNQLYCVNLSGSIPSDIVKKVISQHNKEISASETKSKATNKN